MKENHLIDQLLHIQQNKMVSFHVPGHKNGAIYNRFPYKKFKELLVNLDTTEIPGTDNLHHPQGVIKKAQERASRLMGSDETFFLVNGSTSGIYSMIMAVTNPGDQVIIGRNCHASVINGLILADCTPLYLHPQIDHQQGIALEISPEEVEKMLNSHPQAKAVVITYPTYHGIACNLKKIAEIVHKYDKILLVDEAHGAHLGLSPSLPASALECGADIVVQSTHKTLPAFTQSSMLHLQGSRIDVEKLKFMLRIHQSSSPSYLLLASLDMAMYIYESHGKELMEELLENIKDFKKRIGQFQEISLLDKDTTKRDTNYSLDPTKLWMSLQQLGISGVELEAILKDDHSIQMELSNIYGTLAVTSIGNEKADFQQLSKALEMVTSKKNRRITGLEYPTYGIVTPNRVLTPREALYKVKLTLPIEDTEGMISGATITPYPPGIPILMPGEIISREIIEYVKGIRRAGMEVIGLHGDTKLLIDIIK